ncbi:hypothetical protein PAHAL_8G024200 [Panicum hallii]|jgi:hypothetical protein|uniref:NAC domain-containing protein n=1 Tax=Panicum hallii TaxID=206008 RepID=A0A2T8I7C1_9POAL|nr:NAC domain-containing protein 30-like [Panicum hallii]PVH33571.1 hypothetical protein PAHAL_8G024200 [Panicum hallii]
MEQARWPDVPPCYRFTPTARELIRYYLNPWVVSPGQTPFGEPEGVVCAADVYSADPDTLTSRLRRFGHDDGNWYFLCVARWKDGNAGTRMSRAVQGGGTWHGSGKRVAVRRHGYRQTFEYRDAGGRKSAWLMEEFGSSLPEATDGEGVRVICRVHRTPKAAADGDGWEGRQEETDEAQIRSSKRQRGTLNQEHDFAAADYWTTAALAPPDAGCSYASTSLTAPENGAASTTTWQLQPMMEQGVGYHPTGINGDEDNKGEPEPLEMLPADMGWQQFAEMGHGFGYAAEDARMNEWMRSTFSSCPQPSDSAAQEGDDPRGEAGAS